MADVKPPSQAGFYAGNQLWKLRDPKTGHRPRIFADPLDMWRGCLEYFSWVDQNPLKEEKVFCTKDGRIARATVEKLRPYTLEGLCIFLEIGTSTWQDYRSRDEYRAVVEQVDMMIYSQKFDAAAAGLMDASFIGKAIGLVDKKELSGANGGPIRTINASMTAQEAAEAYAATLHGEKG